MIDKVTRIASIFNDHNTHKFKLHIWNTFFHQIYFWNDDIQGQFYQNRSLVFSGLRYFDQYFPVRDNMVGFSPYNKLCAPLLTSVSKLIS